jgi:TfoX/Sxy family transcriptional regulator of competence genes
MAHDEGLAQRVREILSESLGYEEKKMFGGIGFLLQGNMACGVIREDLIVRVGAENYSEALLRPDVELFDMTGRAMTGWVIVKEPGYRKDSNLNDWVDQGVSYSLTLPPK